MISVSLGVAAAALASSALEISMMNLCDFL
jgi:hypothetical protein